MEKEGEKDEKNTKAEDASDVVVGEKSAASENSSQPEVKCSQNKFSKFDADEFLEVSFWFFCFLLQRSFFAHFFRFLVAR